MRYTTGSRTALVAALLVALLLVAAGGAWAAPKAPKEKVNKPIELQGVTLAATANALDFTKFKTGDVANIFTYLPSAAPFWDGHDGIFDASMLSTGGLTDDSACLWSANLKSNNSNGTGGINGLGLETPRYYRYSAPYGYQKRFGVSGVTPDWGKMTTYFVGKLPSNRGYSLFTAKTNESYWYCSKVVWRGVKAATGVDIDYNGGTWVTPLDVYRSPKMQAAIQ